MTERITHQTPTAWPPAPGRRRTKLRGAPAPERVLRLCPTPTQPEPADPILIVDDDPQMRRMIGRELAEDEREIELAASRRAALDRAGRRHFSLAICDVQFAEATGIELACELKQLQPELGILMVSDDDNPVLAAAAAERGGAFNFLVKPFTPNELRINVSNTLRRCRLERNSAANEERLRQAVDERTEELSAAIQGLIASRAATIRHLSKAVEMRDPTTHAHIDRIGELSALLAVELGWSEDQAELLRMAASMHDVGKIGIPDRILLKPGPLTPHEREEMERHTLIGHEILTGSDSSLLNLAALIALTHHERVDGSGYPHRLLDDEIPQAGRIVAVADVFDALTHDRVYRRALPLDAATDIMRQGRGAQFDPGVLDVLLANLDQALQIQNRRGAAGVPGSPPGRTRRGTTAGVGLIPAAALDERPQPGT